VKCNKTWSKLIPFDSSRRAKKLGARFFLNLWNNQVKEIPHVVYIKQKTCFARSIAAASFPISALLSTYKHSLQQANSRKNSPQLLYLQLVNIFPSNLAGLALNSYQKKNSGL
jgi:hypothetical protein